RRTGRSPELRPGIETAHPRPDRARQHRGPRQSQSRAAASPPWSRGNDHPGIRLAFLQGTLRHEAAEPEREPGPARTTVVAPQLLRLPDGVAGAPSGNETPCGPDPGGYGCRCRWLRLRSPARRLRVIGEFQTGHELSLAEEEPDSEPVYRPGGRAIETLRKRIGSENDGARTEEGAQSRDRRR